MKDQLELLEEEIKKVWKQYADHDPIRGMHTEIEIEPKALIGEHLNPEVATLLASLYLSKTTVDDVEKGKVEITDEALVIKDENKKPIAIIRSQKIIHDYKGMLGL